MQNLHDKEYNRLLRLVLSEGRTKHNRTGINTTGVFGAQARFDLSKGFPLLTTKKVFMKGITHELLWFLKGDTNIKYLVDNGVNIWNDNAYAKYLKIAQNAPEPDYEIHVEDLVQNRMRPMNKEEYVNAIRVDPLFAHNYGELGEGTYGGMWRAFPYYTTHKGYTGDGPYESMVDKPDMKALDQITKVVNTLRTNPDDRRIIVSAWHPYWVDHCALPPCHVLFHFNTEELSQNERWELFKNNKNYDARLSLDEAGIPRRRLNCLLYQRSCDLFLGVPFNIASYALLTSMVAHVTNMVPGTFVHTYGDLHIYKNHLDQVQEQLSRESYDAPTLALNSEVKEIDDFKYEDIKIEDYKSHAAIKAEMAV